MNNYELAPFLQANWEKNHFSEPSLIQEKVFPEIQAKKNVVGIAPTGSGKTLAYLIPLLNQAIAGQANQLLILTSSQELAMQVVEVARQWTGGSDLKVQPLIGGASIKRQQEGLKKRPELLIGTPGRVLELVTSKKLKVHQLQTIVFDEIDQLIQGQNLTLIQRILKAIPKETQRLYFSATADRVLEELQHLDAQLVVADVSETDQSQGTVRHFYLETTERKKVDMMRRLLNMPIFWGIFFFNQVADLGAAEEKLLYHQLPVAGLASDQSKLSRKQAIEGFKKHRLLGLLTTDIASRGLDIPALPFVINVDFPLTAESYLHRAGRVGRMGNEGTVISMLASHEIKEAKRIAKKLQIALTPIYLHGGELTTEEPIKLTEKPKKKKTKSRGNRRR
ncbi:DEAD/DEAH box helicase [Enterococcus florum]|uniref:DEAD/DEAH box helicase n=1 Tax=Enterococcus florum TaxID=2480627 RepID=A0A4P5P7Y1_9ENTE|nr:DEAD/DEAH box helicase [Enterococcus florum]GCF93950.1 DEAD/DEAH box helicase [Enterococcus florum]